MPVLGKIPRQMWQDELKEWLESPMVRMAIKGLVPEGKNEDFTTVLEAAFEAGVTHGVTNTLGAIAMRHEHGDQAIKLNGIPQPDHGHA